MNETIERAAQTVANDVRPQSADHTFRLVVCGALIALGAYIIVTHPAAKAWERGDLIIALAPIAGGLAIAFTGSVLAIVKAIPLPWKKNGNGNEPPPPAEAA